MAEAGSFKWTRTSNWGGGEEGKGLRSDLDTEWKELDPPARFLREEP